MAKEQTEIFVRFRFFVVFVVWDGLHAAGFNVIMHTKAEDLVFG